MSTLTRSDYKASPNWSLTGTGDKGGEGSVGSWARTDGSPFCWGCIDPEGSVGSSVWPSWREPRAKILYILTWISKDRSKGGSDGWSWMLTYHKVGSPGKGVLMGALSRSVGWWTCLYNFCGRFSWWLIEAGRPTMKMGDTVSWAVSWNCIAWWKPAEHCLCSWLCMWNV